MKILPQQAPVGEPEIIVRYAKETQETKELFALLALLDKRIAVSDTDETLFLPPTQVLYSEAVDGAVYVYTANAVYRTHSSLQQLEQNFAAAGFLRCSKSMVVNLHGITRLRAQLGGRIAATLQNGEIILISRHYAAALRLRIFGNDGSAK